MDLSGQKYFAPNPAYWGAVRRTTRTAIWTCLGLLAGYYFFRPLNASLGLMTPDRYLFAFVGAGGCVLLLAFLIRRRLMPAHLLYVDGAGIRTRNRTIPWGRIGALSRRETLTVTAKFNPFAMFSLEISTSSSGTTGRPSSGAREIFKLYEVVEIADREGGHISIAHRLAAGEDPKSFGFEDLGEGEVLYREKLVSPARPFFHILTGDEFAAVLDQVELYSGQQVRSLSQSN